LRQRFARTICKKGTFRQTSQILIVSLVVRSKSQSKMKFKCYFCSSSLRAFKFYIKHIINHTKEYPFFCTLCKPEQNQFKHEISLLLHAKNYHPKMYTQMLKIKSKKRESVIKYTKCYFCLETIISGGLTEHISTHTLELGHKCDFPPCPKRYRRSSAKRLHMKKLCPFNPNRCRNERNFTCYFCKLKVSSFGSLNRHVRSHTEEKPLKCLKCKETFALECRLEYHKKLKHNLGKRYKCTWCETEKLSVTDLNEHIRSSHTKDNRCRKCYFCFRSFVKITPEHMARHTGEKGYFCKYCPAEFINGAQFYFHSMEHVGTPQYLKSKANLDKFKNRCYFCDKPFNNPTCLAVHLRSHTKEESFHCTKCKLLSYSWSDLMKCCKWNEHTLKQRVTTRCILTCVCAGKFFVADHPLRQQLYNVWQPYIC